MEVLYSIAMETDFLNDNATQLPGPKAYSSLYRKALVSIAETKITNSNILPSAESTFNSSGKEPETVSFKIKHLPVSYYAPEQIRVTDVHDIYRNVLNYVARPIAKNDKLIIHNSAYDEYGNNGITNINSNEASSDEKFNNFTRKRSLKKRYISTKGTQTDYRDAEIQTNFWISHVLQMNYLDSRILHLTSQKQGKGLLVTPAENSILEEMRVKKILEDKLIKQDHCKDLKAQIKLTLKVNKHGEKIKYMEFKIINELQKQELVRNMNDYILMFQNKHALWMEDKIKLLERNKNEKISKINAEKNKEKRKLHHSYKKTEIPVEIPEMKLLQFKFKKKALTTDSLKRKNSFITKKECNCKWNN